MMKTSAFALLAAAVVAADAASVMPRRQAEAPMLGAVASAGSATMTTASTAPQLQTPTTTATTWQPQPSGQIVPQQQLANAPAAQAQQQQQQPQVPAAPLLDNGAPAAANGAPAAVNAGATGAPQANIVAFPNHAKITFENRCSKPIYIKYSSEFTGRAPRVLSPSIPIGGQYVFANRASPKDIEALAFTPYFVPDATAPDCAAFGNKLKSTPKGQWGPEIWMKPEYAQAIQSCNPDLAKDPLASNRAACTTSSGDFNGLDCPGINTMGYGTRVEWTLNGFANLDHWDISTNYINPESGYIFFNIPVSIDAESENCNRVRKGKGNQILHHPADYPVKCLAANCDTAYQTHNDAQQNGGQIQCPAGTNYKVVFCGN